MKLRSGEPLNQSEYNFKHQMKEMLFKNGHSDEDLDGEFDEDEDEDSIGQEEAERLLATFANEDLEDPTPNDAEFTPIEMLNMNIPWRKTEEFPDKLLDKFVPKTSSQKFNYNQQGFRHCPGKLQRKGMNPQFDCHLLDIDELHFLDVLTLRRFISDDSEILPRKATGLCAKCQRKVELFHSDSNTVLSTSVIYVGGEDGETQSALWPAAAHRTVRDCGWAPATSGGASARRAAEPRARD